METAWIKPKKFTKLKALVNLVKQTPGDVVKNDGDGSPRNPYGKKNDSKDRQERDECDKRTNPSRNLLRKRKHNGKSKYLPGNDTHFKAIFDYKENDVKSELLAEKANEIDPYDNLYKIEQIGKGINKRKQNNAKDKLSWPKKANENNPYAYLDKIKQLEKGKSIKKKVKASSSDKFRSFEERLKLLDEENSLREQRAKTTVNLRKKKKVAEEEEENLQGIKYSQHLGKKKIFDMARPGPGKRFNGSRTAPIDVAPKNAVELPGPANASLLYIEDTPKYYPNQSLRESETWRCKIQKGATLRLGLKKIFTPAQSVLSEKKKKQIIEVNFSRINEKVFKSSNNPRYPCLKVAPKAASHKKFIELAKESKVDDIKNIYLRNVIKTIIKEGYEITDVHLDQKE